MTGFQLDTSGSVELTPAMAMRSPLWAESGVSYWSDLSPFVQGYLEAMARKVVDAGYRFGFSDLAPETLELIRKDCDAAQHGPLKGYVNRASAGGLLWETRQRGGITAFPPLTPTLADDGKVYLRQAQEAQS